MVPGDNTEETGSTQTQAFRAYYFCVWGYPKMLGVRKCQLHVAYFMVRYTSGPNVSGDFSIEVPIIRECLDSTAQALK